MEQYIKSIRAHLDEIASASADLVRACKEYEQHIKDMKPVAESLSQTVKEVAEKKAEWRALDEKIRDGQKVLSDLRERVK